MKLKSISKWLLASAILLVFLVHALAIVELPLLNRLDGMASDIRLRSTLKLGMDDRIVIADIDENSLGHYGQWPWNRHHLATLVDTLFDHYKIKALGFDMVFAEAAGERFIDLQKALKNQPGISSTTQAALEFEAMQDAVFAKSLQGRAISAGIVFQQHSPTKLNELPPPIAQLDAITHLSMGLPKPMGYTANRLAFHEASVSSGFFDNPAVDSDGNFRRVPLLQSFQGLLYPSLALSVAKLALDDAPLDIQLVEQGPYLAIESVQLGHRIIDTDTTGAVNIPFRGPEGSFVYLSIHDILQKTISLKDLQGKVVLLGTSAPGLLDLRSTPVDESMPGVEVHANIIAGILDGHLAKVPAYIMGAMLVIYLVMGVLLIILPHFLSPTITLIFCSGLALAYGVINYWLWLQGIMLPLASPILLCVLFFMFHMSWGFFVESKKKRAITRLFGQYVPPELVDEMAKQPDAIRLEGQSKNLSVLFSDVRDFTSISENIEPADLTLLMNQILTPMTEAIYQNLGTVDKYMGDAIMAFWGAPLDEPEHAYKAVCSALDMHDKLADLNKKLSQEGFPHIKIGVGINTGTMNVGNMGSEYRMAYTVMGDAVNLGSRLEGLTKNYGAKVVVSEATQQQAPQFLYRRLDMVRVKGKTEPISIFEPLMLATQASDQQIEHAQLMESCFDLYISQKWSQALETLNNMYQVHDPAYMQVIDLYKKRIEAFQETPPPKDWDGVFMFSTK